MEYICKEHGKISEDPVTHAAQYHNGESHFIAIPETKKESNVINKLRSR